MRRIGLRAFASVLIISASLLALPSNAGETTLYVYDALGRLVEVRKSGTINDGVETAIAYDPAGNRTDYDVTGSNGAGSDGGGVTGGVGDGPEGDGGGGSPPPETPPAFSVNSTGTTEGQSMVFTVTKTGSVQNSYSVNWYTSNGTALAGADYGSASGTLNFTASETQKQISIATIDDSAVEGLETFYLNLNGTSGGATISDPQGAGQITDNDTASNSPPIADDDQTALCNLGFILPLENDTDPDGDTIIITSVTVTSGSMTATHNDTVVTVNNIQSSGTIQYTIADTLGQTDTAIITLTRDCGGGGPQPLPGF